MTLDSGLGLFMLTVVFGAGGTVAAFRSLQANVKDMSKRLTSLELRVERLTPRADS